MSRKSILTLAISLALLFTGSPVLLESHVHEAYDDTTHCALCSFASTAVAIAGQPVRVPVAPARTDMVRPASQNVQVLYEPAANRTRAPPAHLS
jgi:hypothetical protein